MASFETHLSVTTVAVGVMSIPLLSAGLITTQESMLLLFFGVIGGMLPDIDSDRSIPVSIAFKVLSLIFPLLIICNFSSTWPLLKIVMLWVLLTLLLHLVFTYVFLKLTVHRGIFHTIGAGVLFGELLTIFLLYSMQMNSTLAILSGLYLSFGFLTHLILDEIFSVDLLNSRLKRSSGTALKLYAKNNLVGSFLINLLAVLALFLIPDIGEVLKLLSQVFEKVKIF